MTPELMIAFRPIVDSTINVQGANKEWTTLVNVYNKIPFISKPLESILLILLLPVLLMVCFSVAKEEEDIRTKYEFRKTDMMKKVFGYAEQDLNEDRSKKANKH